MSRLSLPHSLVVFTDGAIRPELGASGLAAVVSDASGVVYGWWAERAGRLTCNEAEYAAVLLALGRLAGVGRRSANLELDFLCDSRVVVDQMQGRAAAHSPALRQALGEARRLCAAFQRVSFSHIPRRRNRLADALANNAVEGSGTENCAALWEFISPCSPGSRALRSGAGQLAAVEQLAIPPAPHRSRPAQGWLGSLLAQLRGSRRWRPG